MKSFLLFNVLVLFANIVCSKNPVVEIKTTEGTLKVMLYEDTPFHTENFLKLAKQGYYDSLLFHRVIKDFMVQTGDPNSKKALPGSRLGFGGPDYTIPQEIKPQYYHKKGALAAARQGDHVNPQKSSSGSQFYIVQGKKLDDATLDMMESGKARVPFTAEQRNIYKTLGGTPHLDYQYTVFGEVIQGLEIIDKIVSQATDRADRPIKDIRILYVKQISK